MTQKSVVVILRGIPEARRLEYRLRRGYDNLMKTRILILIGLLMMTGCRGGGGPATRAGREVDNAVNWVGYGVRRTGEGIQRAVN
jgi:hypothetical protein